MSSKTEWYTNHIIKELHKSAREWVKNKINGSEKIEKCEPTIE